MLLIPALLLALIGAHLTMIVRQKHTDFPGIGRNEKQVAGEGMFPVYGTKAGGWFMIVAGTLTALGGMAQINPVWYYGPFDPAKASNFNQPDWYMLFIEGMIRMFPPWAIRTGDHTVSPLFWPGVVLPGAMFTIAAFYPFIEARRNHDHRQHHVLQRPRENPTRTALGAMSLAWFVTASLCGTDDVTAKTFHLPIEEVIWGGRIALLLMPPIAFFTARAICNRLLQHDRLLLQQGIGTGEVRRMPDGSWAEVTRQVDAIGSGEPDAVPYRIPVETER